MTTQGLKYDGEYAAPRKVYFEMDINEKINLRSNCKPTIKFRDLPIFELVLKYFRNTGAIYGYGIPLYNLHQMYQHITPNY